MADSSKLIPFILAAEGGMVNNAADRGGLTNKGITWSTWTVLFGDTDASFHRFRVMDAEDWGSIFKPQYWDKCFGSAINSQRVANVIVDWVYTSGQYYPELHIQELINHVFKKHIAEDGHFGPATIESLNQSDEATLYNDLINRRKQYYNDIVEMAESKGDTSQRQFLGGWLNRVNNLVTYNLKQI